MRGIAYRFSTGITTNFVFNPLNLVDAINVMGMDVIYYNDIIDQNKEEEILASARNVGVYPEPDSIFIYDDIVVIKFTED